MIKNEVPRTRRPRPCMIFDIEFSGIHNFVVGSSLQAPRTETMVDGLPCAVRFWNGAKHSPLGRRLRNPGGPGQIWARNVPFANFSISKMHDRGWGRHICVEFFSLIILIVSFLHFMIVWCWCMRFFDFLMFFFFFIFCFRLSVCYYI